MNLTKLPLFSLQGNGLNLVYKGAPINPREENNIGVRFFPGNWYKIQPDSRREYPASRQDLMMVLQQVDQLLIRYIIGSALIKSYDYYLFHFKNFSSVEKR